MRPLMIIGIILLVVGIASFFVPIPFRERHGVSAGPISIGVTTTERRTAPPAISAALIVAGAVLMFAGKKR